MIDNSIVDLCYSRCYAYLDKIGVSSNAQKHITGPLCRYILGIPHSLPIRHIVLGERPYGTQILPYVASAMSYDPDLSPTTPSVHYIARDIDNHTGMSYDTACDWFQDSWKYLRQGVLILNVCTYISFMNPLSDRERVATEEFIRDLIKVSVIMTGERVHVCCMGNPAQHSAGRIRSSLSNPKLQVSVHRATNPAWPSHKKGDQRSPEVTLGGKSVIKYLHDIVATTLASGLEYTFADYDKMAGNMDATIDNVVSTHTAVGDRFEKIEMAFKSAPDGKTIDDGEVLFRLAKDEVRLACKAMQEFRVKLSFININEPAGTAKPTYMNKRQPYNQQPSIAGSASRAPSSRGTPGKSQSVGFANTEDSDEDKTAPVATPSETTASTAIPTPATPSTPKSAPITPRNKINRANSTYSTTSHKSKAIGFATVDEDSDEEDVPAPTPVKSPQPAVVPARPVPSKSLSTDSSASDLDMTPDEIRDMEYVAAHIGDNDEEYDPMFVNVLSEAVKSSRAQSPNAKQVLKVIRVHHENGKLRTIKDALGIESGIADVASPIVQWLMNNATL